MMKSPINQVIRSLCLISLLIPYISQANDRYIQIHTPEIDLASSHNYQPSDITIIESNQQITITGRVERRIHSHSHIRSTVNVDLLDKNNTVLTSVTTLVNSNTDKASHQRYLPFTVSLPITDDTNYIVRVTTE